QSVIRHPVRSPGLAHEASKAACPAGGEVGNRRTGSGSGVTAQVRRREKGHTLVHRVTVVGAGIVGLSCAWFLQERGVEVTVLERDAVCSGSSWGNAGWLAPALTVPLPEPSVLRYGLRAMLDPKSPLYVPPRLDPN